MNRGRASLATVFDQPVFLARQMCGVCRGKGKVLTPAMAGWTATVERIKDDILAANGTGVGAEQAAYDSARRQVGDPPDPTQADCQGCDGRGYNETELTVNSLAELLASSKGSGEGAE